MEKQKKPENIELRAKKLKINNRLFLSYYTKWSGVI